MHQYDRFLYAFNQVKKGILREDQRKVIYNHRNWQLYMSYFVVPKLIKKLPIKALKAEDRLYVSTLINNPQKFTFAIEKINKEANDFHDMFSVEASNKELLNNILTKELKHLFMGAPRTIYAYLDTNEEKLGKYGNAQGELVVEVLEVVESKETLEQLDSIITLLLDRLEELNITDCKHPWSIRL